MFNGCLELVRTAAIKLWIIIKIYLFELLATYEAKPQLLSKTLLHQYLNDINCVAIDTTLQKLCTALTPIF